MLAERGDCEVIGNKWVARASPLSLHMVPCLFKRCKVNLNDDKSDDRAHLGGTQGVVGE